MAGKKRSIHIEIERLEKVLKERKMNKSELQRKLADIHPYQDKSPLISKRQFWNILSTHECQPLVLDEMARILDVNPFYLTGNIPDIVLAHEKGKFHSTFHEVALKDVPYKKFDSLNISEMNEMNEKAFNEFMLSNPRSISAIDKYRNLSQGQKDIIRNYLNYEMNELITAILEEYASDQE